MTIEQIKLRAKNGDRRAQGVLAKRFEIGFEIRESKKQALLWYRKSAEQGFALSQFRLASMYQSMYLDEAVEEMDEAIHWYREAAKQGIVAAQRELAKAIKSEDPEDAAYWYHLAAEAGDAEAQFKLAELYEEGNGVPKNDEEAFHWYLSAEKLEEDEEAYLGMMNSARYEVGRCYVVGQGVDKNSGEALKRLLPIADPRVTENSWRMSRAQIMVATVFLDPEHARRDLIEAYAWFNLAAAYAPTGREFYGIMSRESASELRDNLSAQLSNEQLKQAQLRSKELFVSQQKIDKRLERKP